MTRRSLVALLIALLVLPVGAASWAVNGAREPDTPADATGLFMFLEPDVDPNSGVQQVYFNAMPEDRNAKSINPNVGVLGSRMVPAGQMGFTAWLGVWKDCNGDSYVGTVETALLEYRNELLLDKTVCPVGGEFNRNGWVSEFLWIGNDTPTLSRATFPRFIADPDAQVWGDFGRPGVEDEVHYDCPQLSLPRGSTESTGGLLVSIDCQFGYNGAKTVNTLDADGGLGLRFDDPHHPEQDCDSALNQPVPEGTYGRDPCRPGETGTLEEDSGDPAFTVWDCSNPKGGADVRDPSAPPGEEGMLGTIDVPDAIPDYGETTVGVTDSEGTILALPAPNPRLDNPSGSWSDGGDNLYAGIVHRCRPSHVVSNLTALEDDFGGTNPADGKRVVDFPMPFSKPPGGVGDFVQSLPTYGGVQRARHPGAYRSDWTYLPPTYLGPTVRNDDLQPAGGLWFTFYAKVGTAVTGKGIALPGGSGFYGSEACGSATTGVHAGWDCDPDHWWNPELGGTAESWPGEMPRPGRPYQLRDTDCYDGTVVAGVPARASLADLSDDGVCPQMP